MKSKTAQKLWPPMLSTIGCIVLLLIISACEDEPQMGNTEEYFNDHPYRSDTRTDIPFDSKELTITPAGALQVTMPDQMFSVQVQGGYSPYNWQVSDNTAGVIWPNSANSDSAIYKAYQVKNNSIIVIDAGGRSASKQVVTEATVALAIIPDQVDITAGSGVNIQFVATGGYEPYEWTSMAPALGNVDNNGVYTDLSGLGASATNLVTVTDSQGSAVTATIVIVP